MVKFDAAAPGTSAAEWAASFRLDSLPPLDLRGVSSLAVVAAHPDDETLGAGGLIAAAAQAGITVSVIVVTDGAASNPKSAVAPARISAMRSRELRDAIRELAPGATIVELGFADGGTDESRDRIADRLAEVIPKGAAIVCPWRQDGHHDHRVVGELCVAIAAWRGAVIFEYPIWMWHWARPNDLDATWATARTFALSAELRDMKLAAIDRHASQIRGVGVAPEDSAVLLPGFVEHFTVPRELYFVTGAPNEAQNEASKDEQYFDELYDRNPDPWRLSTRWYESRKRAISVASLPRENYRSALEIGCSVGELTALLAERSEKLLAIDISLAAVRTARARTAGLHNVRVSHQDAMVDFPHGLFDLIVLSEVGYYWDARDLQRMIATILDHLANDGELLACHWRHPVADYPISGDAVHESLRAVAQLHSVVLHREEDFVLEIFSRSTDSVARREGLLPPASH